MEMPDDTLINAPPCQFFVFNLPGPTLVVSPLFFLGGDASGGPACVCTSHDPAPTKTKLVET